VLDDPRRHQGLGRHRPQYECGIMDRVESWFDSLGIRYEVKPKVIKCMMHTEGECYRDYTFFFEK
jgi:hypothetical protein